MSAPSGAPDKPLLIAADGGLRLRDDDVVMVLLGRLGDVLNATALFSHLVAKHRRRLVFVTTKACAPIVMNNPYLEKVVVVPQDMPEDLATAADWQRLREVGREYAAPGTTIYNLHIPTDYRKVGVNIVQYWARTVGVDPTVAGLRPAYFPSAATGGGVKWRNYLILGNGGTAHRPSKRWPIRRWDRLVRGLRSGFPGMTVLQLGGVEDPLVADAEDLRGRTSIDDTYQLLRSARGGITNNSFLAHFAAAAGCPVFVVFGPTSPTHFYPLGRGEVVAIGGHRYWTLCSRSLCRFTFGLVPCLAFPSTRRVMRIVDRSLRRRGGGEARSDG